MSSKKKSKSLGEKIGDIVSNVPKAFESDDETEETRAKVVDYESENDDDDDDVEDFKNVFNKSNLRKRNAGLLADVDERYSAKKVSKNKLFNQDDSSEEDEDDNSEDNGNINNTKSDDSDNESEEDGKVSDDSEEDDGDEEHSDKDDAASQEDSNNSNDDNDDDDDESDFDDLDQSADLSNPLRRDRGPKKDCITTVSNTNVTAEIEKGEAVRRQLQLWENLLEMRIKLQKCLVDSNKMPQHDVYKNYDKNNQFRKECKNANVKVSSLLSNLLDLQTKLLNQYPETKGILSDSKKNKAGNVELHKDDDEDEEIPSDFEGEEDFEDEEESKSKNGNADEEEEDSEESDEEEKDGPPKKMIKLDKFEQIIAKNHKAYREYRNSVIQKWNDKVRVATGAISKGPNQPALQQIEFALANKEKLRRKTQLKRSEYEIIGKSTGTVDDNEGRRLQEYDEEIYDDDDFYHQLLKELIEFKSADIQDPLKLSQQWVQLQNMRSKMKRKIDTRATKGRRLRYDVHQKLVNFMAPNSVDDTWTDHAKDELYSSLFGKIKPVSQSESKTAQ